MHGMSDEVLERILTNGVKGFVAGVVQGALQEMQQPEPRQVRRTQRQVEATAPMVRRAPRKASGGSRGSDARQRAKAWVERTGGFDDVEYEDRHIWKEEAERYEQGGLHSKAYGSWTNYYSALRNR